MMDAPERIWAVASLGLVGTGRWVTQGLENPHNNVCYILATPEALAASPEVHALIEAAVMRALEAAADRIWADLMRHTPMSDYDAGYLSGVEAACKTVRALTADPAAVARIVKGGE